MTAARLTGRHTSAERIEQAIARGLTATAICDALGASAEQVHAVWDRLDALDDEEAEPVLNPTMLIGGLHPPHVDMPDTIATLPSYWDGRPIASYFGPAAPEVIERLVDAVCPPRSARRFRKNWTAA